LFRFVSGSGYGDAFATRQPRAKIFFAMQGTFIVMVYYAGAGLVDKQTCVLLRSG
jgi:hypothetical protein